MRPGPGSGNCGTVTSTATTSTAGRWNMCGCACMNIHRRDGSRSPAHAFRGFKALLEIGPESTATQGEIDAVFRRLLDAITATEVTEIERYD